MDFARKMFGLSIRPINAKVSSSVLTVRLDGGNCYAGLGTWSQKTYSERILHNIQPIITVTNQH